MTDQLRNWRQGVVPHQDIRDDQVSEALFAVNLSRAINREGAVEYRDPVLFFERTHLTRTLQSLIRDVLAILTGSEKATANSVLHLQTNFGGGKSHAELALYHLLTSPKQVLSVPHLKSFLADSGITQIPQAAVAVLPCADLPANGRAVTDGSGQTSLRIHTLWGELAYRLGGLPLYERVRENDAQRTPPGVEILRRLLSEAGPNLILMDELLHYVDKAAAIPVVSSNLGTQTVAFLRELTEAVDDVPHSVLVVSLTASRMEDIEVLSGEQAEFTLSKMEDILRRVEDTRTPIEKTEIYEIVRVRLFSEVKDDAAASAAAAYRQFYQSDPWREQLPSEVHDPAYEDLLRRAYPLHPSLIQVLYERWGSRPQFQLTRGTLRFLSHLLAHLWKSTDLAPGALIHPLDVDLADDDIRGEALRVAGSVWESIIGTDIAQWEGDKAIAQRLDEKHGGLYRRLHLVQGVASSVFLYTHGGLQSRPTPRPEIRLAVAQPSLPLADLNQAFDDCKNLLYYFYDEDSGFIFKTEPNPNKVLADERSNVPLDDARRQVEKVVAEVLGPSGLFNVNLYGFYDSRIKEPGDVADDARLQLVALSPRVTMSQGKPTGKAGDSIREIGNNYGKKHRMNRNRVLFMAPDSAHIANAVSRASDWLAAERVMENAGLMGRFSESQRETIKDKRTGAANDTKDHVRRAYNTVLLPTGGPERDLFELSYVPPNKTVIQQAEDDLLSKGKLHRQFNPDLFASRWESLWLKTATVITTEDLWDKFARREDAPILTSVNVLQETIRQGVERELFGYGLLLDADQDKLKAASYARGKVYFGEFDAAEMREVEISQRAVLLRAAQVQAQFPAISPEEVAMVFHGERQTVEMAFGDARRSAAIQGMVYKGAFFEAVCAGVKAGLFGYTPSPNAPVLRGPDADIAPHDIRFSGWLIGEDVPLPVTADEITRLMPADGRIAVETLFQNAIRQYGAERANEQALASAIQRCIRERRFGFAPTATASVAFDLKEFSLQGFLGQPADLPPGTRIIRFQGAVTPIELASILQTAAALSKLGQSHLHLALKLELTGEINDHAVTVSLTQLKQRVQGLRVEDSEQ